MNKQIVSRMSKQARNTDKVLSKLAYKFSSSIHPLDLAIKHVYEIKSPDEDQDSLALWKYLEEALLSTRLLTLDALSILNVARRDKVLKSFMPSHQPTPETDSVFGGELQEIMEKGNRETKFFNNALYQLRRQESLECKPTRSYYNSSTRGTRYNRFQTPRYRNFSGFRQGNGYRGGSQTDRPNQQQSH
ncbi:hypothetical protein C2G38_2047670 [Gigaspora rosea]|uniref:Uncharacterized protein n=1 Tax=Gigaspora rosea TaxID=44941 RepID=A0A397U4W9_9GLOM|nr:hypothetical protein C2G38_2047670 [Gigaspora rosea]